MSSIIEDKYIEQSAGVFDLFDRHIHSALQMTLRPMKDTNGEVITTIQ